MTEAEDKELLRELGVTDQRHSVYESCRDVFLTKPVLSTWNRLVVNFDQVYSRTPHVTMIPLLQEYDIIQDFLKALKIESKEMV